MHQVNGALLGHSHALTRSSEKGLCVSLHGSVCGQEQEKQVFLFGRLQKSRSM